MADMATLAQETMNVITPLLPLAANKVVEGFGSESGKKLFSWLVTKLKGTPAEAGLDQAVSEPNNETTKQILQLQIQNLVERDPEFRDQLGALLKEIAAASGAVNATQSSHQIGDNNKNAQASGKDITIQIG